MISFFKTYDLPFNDNFDSDQTIINIFGELMGVVFERKVFGYNDSLKLIEDAVKKKKSKNIKKNYQRSCWSMFY